LLWLVPLVAAQACRPRHIARLLFVIILLSQWIYPSNWNPLWRFEVAPTLVLALRNILLVALFVLLWRHRADPVPARVTPGSEGPWQAPDPDPEGPTRQRPHVDLSRPVPCHALSSAGAPSADARHTMRAGRAPTATWPERAAP